MEVVFYGVLVMNGLRRRFSLVLHSQVKGARTASKTVFVWNRKLN